MQTIGCSLADSPVGLAAWMLDHDPHSYEQIAWTFEGNPEGRSHARRDPRQHYTLLLPPLNRSVRVPSPFSYSEPVTIAATLPHHLCSHSGPDHLNCYRPSTTWMYTITDDEREEQHVDWIWERISGEPSAGIH